jgi:hypothetical protein
LLYVPAVTPLVSKAIVPEVVMVPPVRPAPAVIEVTVPSVPVTVQLVPFQIFSAELEVSYQNSPTLFPAEPTALELGAVAPTSAGPTLTTDPQVSL